MEQVWQQRITPQFQQQINDLETSLANKGIPIGSEAYQRAMTDAQNNFNNALNQAAYQSVINGQQSYSQSLADSINSANFSNNAQQSYIDQILSLLENSVSGYQKQSDIYNVNAAIKQRQAQAEQSGWNNLIGSAVTAGRLYYGMPK